MYGKGVRWVHAQLAGRKGSALGRSLSTRWGCLASMRALAKMQMPQPADSGDVMWELHHLWRILCKWNGTGKKDLKFRSGE